MISYDYNTLLRLGVHVGHKISVCKHTILPYIIGYWKGISLLDVNKIVLALEYTLNIIHKSALSNEKVLFFFSGSSFSRLDNVLAQIDQYLVFDYCYGGLISNWSTVMLGIKRLRYYNYRISSIKNVRLKNFYRRKRSALLKTGLTYASVWPSYIVLFCDHRKSTVAFEANTLDIPVIGVLDSNADTSFIDYVIPAGGDTQSCYRFICMLFGTIYRLVHLTKSKLFAAEVVFKNKLSGIYRYKFRYRLIVLWVFLRNLIHGAFKCALQFLTLDFGVKLLTKFLLSGNFTVNTTVEFILYKLKIKILKLKCYGFVNAFILKRLHNLIRLIKSLYFIYFLIVDKGCCDNFFLTKPCYRRAYAHGISACYDKKTKLFYPVVNVFSYFEKEFVFSRQLTRFRQAIFSQTNQRVSFYRQT